jgi:hypothetical protein
MYADVCTKIECLHLDTYEKFSCCGRRVSNNNEKRQFCPALIERGCRIRETSAMETLGRADGGFAVPADAYLWGSFPLSVLYCFWPMCCTLQFFCAISKQDLFLSTPCKGKGRLVGESGVQQQQQPGGQISQKPTG